MSEITEQNQDRLIIVIPAYNEEENIENVVAQWHPIVENTGEDSRLFVINDGSTDRTQEELDHLQGKYPQLRTVKKENQGHGATILYGYRCAIAEGADYIFQTDSDGQTLPEEFWKLWADRKKCGLLIGSRKRRQDGWQRIFVTRVLRLVILVTFHCWVEDANTPFRLMRAAELEEVLKISLEMRRRVKEQLKKLGGMEFYDVNFSYIDNETFEEFYVSVPEQGGGKLIPEGMCNPGQVYTVAQGKTGMLGVFRLESQMMPGNGKFERSGLGSDGKCKEATNTAFNFLKANSNRISGSISTTTKDYIINYQDLQGIGMTDKLALPTLIALASVALGKPVASSLAVLGEISIAGTLIKVDELANSLQVCLDSGAKKVLLPIVSAADIGAVPSDLIGCFNLIFYSSAEDAVYKALGVE